MENIARTSSGCVPAETNPSSPKRNNTPANIPEASDTGTRRIAFSNTPENPASIPIAAASTKAPIASDSGNVVVAPTTSIAAPGVDHAVTTGIR